jgi:cytochrome c
MKSRQFTAAAAAAFSLAAMLPMTIRGAAAGDAMRGQALYESRCTACHSLDHSRIGPASRGVYGRQSAQVEGFDYSPALKGAHVVWDAKSLDRWLTDPEAFIPGQKMGYMVQDPQDRADLIAFLESPAAR